MNNENRTSIAAVYVVLKKDGRTLFHRRKNSESTEDPEACVQTVSREIQIELGDELGQEAARVVHVKHRNGKDGSRLDFFYTASAWDGETPNTETEKHAGLSWELSYAW